MSLVLDGITRRFGDFLLGDVSLTIDAGAYCVLVGPSGCGKSVLLLTLAGLFAPEAGRILVAGRDLTGTSPERRDLGLVFQHAALFPHYGVRGNLEYGLKARGLDAVERRRRVDEIIERLRLGPILDRPVATLSGGEAQRVAIGRALATRPKLLLLDEPLSLLDHNARLELQGVLARLHLELGTTTLHVTHSRDEAQALADRLAVMLGGTIVQAGRMTDVLARPRCAFVARFLGLPPESVAEAPPCAAECGEAPTRCAAPTRAAGD